MNSAGSGTPLHFTGWKTLGQLQTNLPLLITEGALKADVADRGLPRYFSLAGAGVGCSHQLIERVSRGKSVTLVFDNNY